MLKNGSQGEEVTALQKSLMAMGINPGSADGIFGPKTEAAVKQCQDRCGVTADGIWGPASQAAFDRMKAEMMNPTPEAEEPTSPPDLPAF
jgi:peptidoglycan hydrolase-like protein with peptidoglycan-binding domain